MKENKLHTFSIVIPALNEGNYISSCLKSLINQDYPGSYEIIVADNGSLDKTVSIAKELGVKVVNEPLKGVSHALIRGCSEAKNEILVFTDADTRPSPNWLSELNSCFNTNPDTIAVGGAYHFFGGGGVFNFISRYLLLPIYLKLFYPRMKSLSCVNMAVRRDTYERSGGFNPMINWGQDAELCFRLKKYGEIIFDPNIVMLTSFRRYDGGHVNILVRNAHILKELYVQINRYVRIAEHNRFYPAQKPIRVKPASRLRRFVNNSATFFALFLVYLFFIFALPSTQFAGGTMHHGIAKSDLKMVALTFDDGPYGKPTEQILDILHNQWVKATFFVTGMNAEKYPEILKREVNEGHLIGNHSFNHSKALFLESSHKIKRNIAKTDSVVFSIVGLHPRFFRPCYGLTSKLMTTTLKKMGYEVILWNDGTRDYDSKEPSQTIVNHILRQIKPNAIILLHDGRDTQINYPRENVVRALPQIIVGIRQAGYTMVTLDQLLNQPPYSNLK
jgi:peptidoglycan-N-acetylglucosamine deacetylase